ncbi:GNAT family N-acetyltransferase [Wenzhouxiangella sp. AB-CW3]|uniref:GNAT family N-acetyltransferase n=1 Tax=Wenzhouxiangella sp. AB-CW3 TaxID=2771012 RepID=UPI00168B6FF0|nr:GNAT family N-acetyltransferase [Wenzhouxiangella sp. AB-CW3]QOC22018.1 GNAT family N-acetyltransferase [Wenzhouxiangella sp. AB-CW3]
MQPAADLSNERYSDGIVSQVGHAISICNDASEFERLRPEWELLRQPGEEQDPFLSCDWFAKWWRAFGESRELYLVTARRNGRLRAVFPLMLERAWRHGIPLRRLAAIGNDHTPRFDLIRADDDEHLHRDIWNHVMTLRNRWDVFDLPRLSADSTTADRFVRLAEEQNVNHSLWQRAPESPWIHIFPCWDDYLDSRSANFRKALRRKMRRLAAAGRVGLETVTGREELDKALADGLHIEAEGWKGSNRTAISSQPEVEGFYTELAGVMADRGQLRLHFLTLNDVRIAFDYSVIANRCLYSLKAGHSSAYARFSPGTVILGLILQRAHDEGLIGMDLLGDTDEFKMHWTDATHTHQWLHCYSDSLRGRLLHLIKCRLLPTIRGSH